MRLDVVLGGFLGVMRSVHVMAVRHMGVMRGRLVIAFLVMASGFAVMVGRVLMVLGGLRMMMGSFLRHSDFLSREGFQMASWNLRAFSAAQVAGKLRTGELMVNRAQEAS